MDLWARQSTKCVASFTQSAKHQQTCCSEVCQNVSIILWIARLTEKCSVNITCLEVRIQKLSCYLFIVNQFIIAQNGQKRYLHQTFLFEKSIKSFKVKKLCTWRSTDAKGCPKKNILHHETLYNKGSVQFGTSHAQAMTNGLRIN